MHRICLVFWKSEPQCAYKHYAYKRKHAYSADNHIRQPKRVKILNILGLGHCDGLWQVLHVPFERNLKEIVHLGFFLLCL